MLIEYKNVNIYQQGKLVLEGVDFHVDEGEFIYIIGKVGSGKSSLLKTTYCELDLMKDEAEKAEVLGRNVVSLKRKASRTFGWRTAAYFYSSRIAQRAKGDNCRRANGKPRP